MFIFSIRSESLFSRNYLFVYCLPPSFMKTIKEKNLETSPKADMNFVFADCIEDGHGKGFSLNREKGLKILTSTAPTPRTHSLIISSLHRKRDLQRREERLPHCPGLHICDKCIKNHPRGKYHWALGSNGTSRRFCRGPVYKNMLAKREADKAKK